MNKLSLYANYNTKLENNYNTSKSEIRSQNTTNLNKQSTGLCRFKLRIGLQGRPNHQVIVRKVKYCFIRQHCLRQELAALY